MYEMLGSPLTRTFGEGRNSENRKAVRSYWPYIHGWGGTSNISDNDNLAYLCAAKITQFELMPLSVY